MTMPTLSNSLKEFKKLNFQPLDINSKTLLAAKRITSKYDSVNEKTQPEDMNEIIKRVSNQFDAKEQVNLQDLKVIALWIFTCCPSKKFFKSTLNAIEKYGRKRHFSALFISYILDFDNNNENCTHIARFLKKNKDSLSERWLRMQEKIDIFDNRKVAMEIADFLLKNKADGKQPFQDLGFPRTLLEGSLAQISLIKLGELVKEKTLSGDVQHLTDFIRIITEDNKIKGNARVAAMIGLLSPFSDMQPTNELKNRIKKIVIDSFNDPRISSHAWPHIEEIYGGEKLQYECIQVMKKWLNFETIELFFKIIGEHAIDNQWRKREELWHSYFKQDFVTDVHIILGKNAALTAEMIRRDSEDGLDNFQFGKLRGSTDRDHSVLLMKLSGKNGHLIVTEWSHNGGFRAWSEEKDTKPQFYNKRYDAHKLRKNSNMILQKSGKFGNKIVHIGNWVDRVERYINSEIGIRLSRGK